MTRRARSPRAVPLLLIVGLAVASIGACGPASSGSPTSPPSPSPSPTPDASAGPTPVPTPVESSSTAAPSGEPTQTDTEWGRIWDALPASFPVPQGATPSESIGREASSAEFAVGAPPTDLTTWYRMLLAASGFGTVSAQGPLEDGTWVVDATGAEDCRARVTITPLSGVTHLSILFAAACPYR
jgi:hypothetical protein